MAKPKLPVFWPGLPAIQAGHGCGSASKGFEDAHGIGLSFMFIANGVRELPVVLFAFDPNLDSKLLAVSGVQVEFPT
jgi:hypothetical protein